MVVNAIVVVARRVVDLSSLAPSKSEVYHFGFFPRQCFPRLITGAKPQFS